MDFLREGTCNSYIFFCFFVWQPLMLVHANMQFSCLCAKFLLILLKWNLNLSYLITYAYSYQTKVGQSGWPEGWQALDWFWQVGWSMSKFWPGTDLGGHCVNLVPAIAKPVASVNLPKFIHQGSSLQSNSSMQFNTEVSLSFSLLIWTSKMETFAFLTFKQNPGDLEPYLSLEGIWHLFYAFLIRANWLVTRL